MVLLQIGAKDLTVFVMKMLLTETVFWFEMLLPQRACFTKTGLEMERDPLKFILGIISEEGDKEVTLRTEGLLLIKI